LASDSAKRISDSRHCSSSLIVRLVVPRRYYLELTAKHP
jgi:hypothetical protein